MPVMTKCDTLPETATDQAQQAQRKGSGSLSSSCSSSSSSSSSSSIQCNRICCAQTSSSLDRIAISTASKVVDPKRQDAPKTRRLWLLLSKAVKHGLTATELQARLDISLVAQRSTLFKALDNQSDCFCKQIIWQKITPPSSALHLDISSLNSGSVQLKESQSLADRLSFGSGAPNGQTTTSTKHHWLKCSFPECGDSFSLNICYMFKDMRFVDLVKTFDNTGYVGIWPSEELLAIHVLRTRIDFEGKKILELGSGMTGLGSLTLAVAIKAKRIVMTDGDERCLNNLNVCLSANKSRLQTDIVETRLLRWGQHNDYEDLENKLDFVLCSDCIFSDHSRVNLVNTMWSLLVSNGTAIIIAPNRGTTLIDFVEVATNRGFKVAKSDYGKKSHTDLLANETQLGSPIMLTLTK